MEKNIRIEPMSLENVVEASALCLRVFENSPKDSDYPPRWFRASFDDVALKELCDATGATFAKYFAAIDTNTKKVIGTTGLYSRAKDPLDTVWLGWFCVDPLYRRGHVGTQLLEFTITQAQSMKKKRLKLYTSSHPSEVPAQALYEKRGFKKIGREESVQGKNYNWIYRELML